MQLFNTETHLWRNYLAKNPGVTLKVQDGGIWSPLDGYIGQFLTTNDAKNVLKLAGYPDELVCNSGSKYHLEVYQPENPLLSMGGVKLVWQAPTKIKNLF